MLSILTTKFTYLSRTMIHKQVNIISRGVLELALTGSETVKFLQNYQALVTETSHGGSTYTTEINKFYKSALPPSSLIPPSENYLLDISQGTMAFSSFFCCC